MKLKSLPFWWGFFFIIFINNFYLNFVINKIFHFYLFCNRFQTNYFMGKIYYILTFLVLSGSTIFAQNQSVSGTIKSGVDGEKIPGVIVQIKGKLTNSVSDTEGNYEISAGADDVLIFSFVGFKTQEIRVGSQTKINLTLEENIETLQEVVVLNALGLEKKKDVDLSSSTTINTSEFKRSGESGTIQALSGKTSGLTIVRSSGDPGAGAYLQIRGQNTILGSSSPLIILDGIPISNSSIGGGTAGVIQQSRLNDLNPEDIENITVLKGAAAATVWGTEAANGVIIIKTKSGSTGSSKVKVNVNNQVGWDVVNREFEKQDKFGQGYPRYWATGKPADAYDYIWVGNNAFSWGPKIADRSGTDVVREGNQRFESASGKIYYPITQKNDNNVYNDVNRDQVFRVGSTWNKSVDISFSGINSNTFLSISDWNQKGIIRNNSDYRRTTLRLNNTSTLRKNIISKFNVSYSTIQSNRIQQGSNLAGLYLGYLRTPPDFDNTDYIGTYYDANGLANINAHRGYRRYLGDAAPVYNNPGWTINEQKNPNNVNRIILAPELNWNFYKTVNLTARLGYDRYTDSRQTFFPFRSAGADAVGSFGESNIAETNTSFNLFLSGNHTISKDLNIDWIAGAMLQNLDYSSLGGSANGFTNPFVGDVWLFSNTPVSNVNASRFVQKTRKNGVYGTFNLDYLQKLYFSAGARYEAASTLNDNVLYPSLSAGYIFTRGESSNFLTYGKLRASYGQIGIEPSPYLSETIYGAFDRSGTWGETLAAGVYGNPFAQSSTAGNPDLKRELITEFEIGSDLRFFNNKVSLGFTYYDRITSDAILNLELPASTGFSNIYKNAAEISNKGIEIDGIVKAVQSKNLKVDINANFSSNKNIVESLSGVESVFLAGFTGTSSRVVAGKPFGELWGGSWLRDDAGKLKLDENGFPQASPSEGPLGDPNPKWRGGIGSNINFKGVRVSFLLETFQGGKIWTGTEGVLKYFGIHPETANEVTLTQDLKTYYGRTVAAGTTVRGNIQDFGGGPVLLDADWYPDLGGGFGPVSEQFVVDGSWTKLRELSIGYDLPSKLVNNLKLTNASITLTGRNLFIWSPVKFIDPETNLTGVSKGRGLEYFNNPGVGSYMLTVSLGF